MKEKKRKGKIYINDVLALHVPIHNSNKFNSTKISKNHRRDCSLDNILSEHMIGNEGLNSVSLYRTFGLFQQYI